MFTVSESFYCVFGKVFASLLKSGVFLSAAAIQLPDALWIAKISNLKNLPVPTREIKVNL